MEFKKATDALFDRVSHEDLAKALGVSVASIRQARLDENALARRSPPKGWERHLKRLAEQKAEHFRRLAAKLNEN